MVNAVKLTSIPAPAAFAFSINSSSRSEIDRFFPTPTMRSAACVRACTTARSALTSSSTLFLPHSNLATDYTDKNSNQELSSNEKTKDKVGHEWSHRESSDLSRYWCRTFRQ